MPVLNTTAAIPQVSVRRGATRYYQVYDGTTGALLLQSAALEPLGLQYTPEEVRRSTTSRGVHESRPTTAASGSRTA